MSLTLRNKDLLLAVGAFSFIMYTYNNLGAILCALQCLIILSPSLISRGFLVAAQDVASTLVADEIADFNQTVKVLGDVRSNTLQLFPISSILTSFF